MLTFLERHRKEGLMSRCGTRESEATVVMEGMDAAGRRRRRRNGAARKEGFFGVRKFLYFVLREGG